MSDLRRWSEEGATAEELALLEASRSDRAPAHARLRTLEALALAAAVTTTATATTTAAASTVATTAGAMTPAGATGVAVAATTGGLTVATKVLAISMLGGIVAGGLVVRASHRPVVPAHALVVPAAAKRSVVESANAVLPSPLSTVNGPVPVAPSARSAQPASTEDRLSREVAALELAHRALADHNPESALHLLDRYRARFPAGTLASEETVLRVQALLATGERTRAQALADSYSAAHPDSPYSRRLEGLVHSEQ